MGKIISNVVAFARGVILKVIHKNNKIGIKIRLFWGAEVQLDRKSFYKLGNYLKIDKGALIAVRKNAKLEIGDGVGIGAYNRIISHKKISIGKETILGPNVFIYDHDHKYDSNLGIDRFNYNTSEISIGEKCWIGANVVILRGSHIGDRCLIAAGSVIKGNIPSGTIVIQKRENFFRQIGGLND